MELMDMTLRDIKKEYYSQCKLIAGEILDNLEAEGLDPDSERSGELLHESVDGSPWVFEYFRADLVVALSENKDAWLDAYDKSEAVDNTTKAYFAMWQDIVDYVNNEYFLAEREEK